MATNDIQGRFEVVESFAIASRKEFYLIGQMKEGKIQENWFIHIGLNSSLGLTMRIKTIEEIEMASDISKYTLIIIEAEEDELEFMLSLRVGSEMVTITIEGED